jgi:adenylyl-sulfate kinase
MSLAPSFSLTGIVAEFGDLPELLYSAHHDLSAVALEIRDWGRQEPSDVLILQRDVEGKTRLLSTGGGLYGKPHGGARRLWCELPDRVRVDILQGDQVARTAVRDRQAWWRWDREEGENAGDVTRGAALPAMLDLVVLEPARLLSTMWFEVTGTGSRAAREVIKARGTLRQRAAKAERHVEFEFDAEHGTPLHIATFEADERISASEVLSIDYNASFDPAIFRFELHESPEHQRSSNEPRPHPRLKPSAVPEAAPSAPVLADRGTIWLTGLSGAGKTTIARATERLLHQLGISCCVLDGDELRHGLSSDLGLSREDRAEQARRVAHMATIVADSGVVPIVALVSPYIEDRKRAREIHDAAGVGFVEVWVDTPLEVCAARDTKGLYAAAHALSTMLAPSTSDGSGLTGLTAPYETPTNPELRVSGDQKHPRAAAIAIVQTLLSNAAQTVVLGRG